MAALRAEALGPPGPAVATPSDRLAARPAEPPRLGHLGVGQDDRLPDRGRDRSDLDQPGAQVPAARRRGAGGAPVGPAEPVPAVPIVDAIAVAEVEIDEPS